jgi:crossover junction endodeoxyribonuclease RuvC
MIILGIDPGYGRLGYGIIHRNGSSVNFVRAGCLETNPKAPHEQRLGHIYKSLQKIITKERPAILAIESLFFSKNTKTALRVAETRGVTLLLGNTFHIPIYEFTPSQVKVAACGYGKSDKKQVQLMVAKLLNISAFPGPDDVTDALAIAITAAAHIR